MSGASSADCFAAIEHIKAGDWDDHVVQVRNATIARVKHLRAEALERAKYQAKAPSGGTS